MENSSVKLVWGSEFLDGGFTTVPNMVVRYAPKLVTGKEFHLIMILSSFKHDADFPYPSQSKLGEIMGVSERQIRKLIEGLENKELLFVQYRYDKNGRTSNIYNFQPLLDACLLLHNEDERKENIKNGVKVVTKTKRPKKRKEPEQNVPQLPEQNVPQLPEQNVPEPPEQNVPMNITSINITKEYNNTILQSIYHSELPDTLKSYLRKNHDGLIEKDIKYISNVFKENNLNEMEFKYVLSNVIENGKYKNFQKYFKKSLMNHLNSIENNPKKSLREEMIPSFMKEEKTVTKENEANEGHSEEFNINEFVKIYVRMGKELEDIIKLVLEINPAINSNEIEEAYKDINMSLNSK